MDVFKNLLLSNPRTYTGSGVGLLEASNNLSDVGDATTARNNLSVFSKAESNTRLNALAPRQGVVLLANIGATTQSPIGLGTSDFSLTLLFRPVSWVNTGLLLGTAATNNRFRVFALTSGYRFTFVDGAGAITSYDLTGVAIPTLNVWSALTFALDRDGNATVYLNGVSVGAIDISGSAAVDLEATITAGFTAYNSTSNAADLGQVVFHNFAIPATTTSGVVGVAERYADGVWVRASEQWGFSGVTVPLASALSDGASDDSSLTGISPFQGILTAESGARTGGSGSFFTRLTFNIASVQVAGVRVLNLFSSPIRGRIRYSFWVRIGAARPPRIQGVNGTAGTATVASFANVTPNVWTHYTGTFDQLQDANGFQIACVTGASDVGITFDVDDVVISWEGATLDLIPQGIGRTLIDRSASRNHATVSGTALPQYLQPTDGGKLVARTATNGNEQLQAAAAFDAASRYRITGWTVTALTGTPTISLGNASAGTQYVSGLALTTGVPTAVTLATSIAATANLWCNSNSTDVIIHSITYERVAD